MMHNVCLFVCLLDKLILGFCYSDLTLETGGFELASTITPALEANRLTKCASHHQLKVLAIKRWFPFNFAKILQDRHFVVGGPKTFKLLADISVESGLQNIVLSSLLLFLCAC